ncbi:MAG: pantoate--beta-alanine ligase, partial [Nitrospinota bacterium]
YQQMLVIKRMVNDLNLNVDIVSMPTIREENGLAMSSRNTYLDSRERVSAVSLYKALKTSEDMVKNGERDTIKIINEMERIIRSETEAKIDYISICDPDTLKDIKTINGRALAALSVRIGNARLIDNCMLEVK